MDDHFIEKWQLADEEIRKNLPLGVKLVSTLRGHTGFIGRIAWSPNGKILASPSEDKTIRLWDTETGQCLRILRGHRGKVYSVAFDPTGRTLASGSDNTVNLWKSATGKLIRKMKRDGHYRVYSVAFDPTGKILAGGDDLGLVNLWLAESGDLLDRLDGSPNSALVVAFDSAGKKLAVGSIGSVIQWEVSNMKLIRKFEAHQNWVVSIAIDLQNRTLVTGGFDKVLRLWEWDSGRLQRSLEGHTGHVRCVAFLGDGRILASMGDDAESRLWSVDTGECLGIIPGRSVNRYERFPSLAFHPHLPLLATVGSDSNTPEIKNDRVIHIWELDPNILLGQVSEPSAHYINAKIVLVGDTGVGKTGLSLVLNNQPFEATDSTPGRHVWTLDSQEVKVGSNITQTREALLWDLAGQPGYRIIHQLHLNEVAVALVVFDARSEIDPLAGVRHWERALRVAQQRQGTSRDSMKKFLVSARNDRGGVSISEDRLKSILKEFNFDGYFKTSAKEGWNVKELRAAIEQAIIWEDLPEVSSSQLFADIKSYLLEVKKTGRLLASLNELYIDFAHDHPDKTEKVTDLRDQFNICVGRLENRDLIRQLSFGGYILLQPELLDAYASAMVNQAKGEPEGLGSIAEEVVLAGKFFVPDEQKVKGPGKEQLLLHATVEELICHDLALWENANDGRYLVFPSQFNRDYEDAPEPKGSEVSITFDGPVQSLYSTLAVRLSHSELFIIERGKMWRNAAVFTAEAGGKCGLYLHEFDEARGRLTLFFDEQASPETRFHFEEFVLTHTKRRALDGTVELLHFFVCPECGDPVPDYYVKRLHNKGIMTFGCPCGGTVSLADPKERINFRSEVEAMDKSADRHRDFDVFVMSAKGETSTGNFQEWAGGDRVTLAVVFTDVVNSTVLGDEIKDEAMDKVRSAHFTQSRRLIYKFKGREIKTMGDSFMAAFKSVDQALDYARELQGNTGHPLVKIRAGIHIGSMTVEKGDVFGDTVNFASRVVGSIKGAEIWLSDRAKKDIDQLGALRHKQLCWERHDSVIMKGFPGVFALWSI
ncbi:adenylate/guanylate cyclase domain-containing protein [Methanosarcina sp. UBA289]|uniref:adenylate/guanylate cyclase domain-containing protein n=1 Tax=Methanosarcina sp. UBA289 TaxID=1915574 RepID=UPI0025DF1C50|nr:adenylate/guanylate cyclase domain-containing protein [Methanosarcina sp. UBA289]